MHLRSTHRNALDQDDAGAVPPDPEHLDLSSRHLRVPPNVPPERRSLNLVSERPEQKGEQEAFRDPGGWIDKGSREDEVHLASGRQRETGRSGRVLA